jgi:sugar phosphate isomerase/epimerase
MKTGFIRNALTRRDFLAASAASVGALSLLATGCSQEQMAAGKKKKIPVGLQLYSVRKDAEKDLPGVLKAVKAMGYEGVEFAGYYNHKAPDIRKMLDDNGLVCCGTHTQYDTLKPDKFDETIAFNRTLGNKYIIVPWLDPNTNTTKDQWIKLAKEFTDLSVKLKPHGMRIGYHAHGGDFKKVDGQTYWDILFGNARKDVIMQIDTGNSSDGGGDPIACLRNYPGQAVTVHLKEYSAKNKNAILGEGDLDWKTIFSICETTGGTEWYIIEEEKDIYPPMKAVEMCLKNYKMLRAKG